MKKPKIRELIEAVTAFIKGPDTTKFPFEPHTPAKNFRGAPKYSEEGCVACTGCSSVCPADAIEFIDDLSKDPSTRKMIVHHDECIFCGQCQALCTTREDTPPGIKLSHDFDLAVFDRKDAVNSVEKELAVCEVCKTPITAKAHLDWIAKRLGPLAFSNPTIFMSRLSELGLVHDSIAEVVKDLTRSDRMRIICAKCRRKTTLEK
ncbi:MAG: 4Fe-4S dicluster domain-containing protein [Candidatus Omnitrophota bacterium]